MFNIQRIKDIRIEDIKRQLYWLIRVRFEDNKSGFQ